MNEQLWKLFYPRSICIPGVSSKKGSIGYELTKTILDYGYKGRIFPVNPKGEEILGFKCFRSVTEIDSEIDLAIVVVPKAFAEETINQLLSKKVKSIILITAGFKETGKEGEEAEDRILSAIQNAEARMVGPNCMGIINTLDDIKLNATFVAEHPETGRTGFLSQSGALGAAVLNSLRDTDIKFAHFISVGNKADISENDVLDFWEQDKNISVITMYLESFSNGEKFINYFIEGRISKPVIILKAGRKSGGIKAASSHTGALGSSDKVVNAVLNQFGIIRTDNLNELFNTAKGFENFPVPRGNRTAVVTNAGGPAILCVDMIERCGLKLAELSEITKNKLRGFVHPEGSVNNPVDLLPGGDADSYNKAVTVLLEDEGVDSVISIFVEPVMVKPMDVVQKVYSIESDKPVFKVVMPLPEFWNEYRHSPGHKKPVFRNPEDPAEVISNMLFYHNIVKNNRLAPRDVNLSLHKKGFLTQTETADLCERYALPVITNKILTFKELSKAELEYPVVIKAVGKNIIHKSELNAVRLNIKSKEDLITAAADMKNLNPDSFLIQPFTDTKYEVLLGAIRDPNFGPMIMFGSGGKYVEYYDDTAMKSAYLSEPDIEDLINSTHIGKILQGVRGEKPADIKKIKETITNLAQMMLDNCSIVECDLNPLIITNKGDLFAVDVRIKAA